MVSEKMYCEYLCTLFIKIYCNIAVHFWNTIFLSFVGISAFRATLKVTPGDDNCDKAYLLKK